MQEGLKRTTTADADFQALVTKLDHELWHELKEDQATYDQFNQVPHIQTALVYYREGIPAACGCFKEFDRATVEVKRMFVDKRYRGQGLSKQILRGLEQWALELGNRYAVLETSIHFDTARKLYTSSNYQIIPNYPPYEALEASVCMKKILMEAM